MIGQHIIGTSGSMVRTLNSAGLPNVEMHHRIAETSGLAARHHMRGRMKQSQKGRKWENCKKAGSYNMGKKIRWIWVLERWLIAWRSLVRGQWGEDPLSDKQREIKCPPTTDMKCGEKRPAENILIYFSSLCTTSILLSLHVEVCFEFGATLLFWL